MARGMRPEVKTTLIDAVEEEVARRLSLCWMRGEWISCSWPWRILEIICLHAGWNLSHSVDSAAGGMRSNIKLALMEAVTEGVARRWSRCWMRSG